ncbi:hypothetical protein BM526_12840 [Alteromonas mediterranea]|nr:hypothetical protein BM526_12840 [Alteromonas mediterranea]
MIFIGIALCTIGIFVKAYSAKPLGISFEFDTRNGPFFGVLLYATGCLLANFKACSNWLFIGLIVFLVGVQLHF